MSSISSMSSSHCGHCDTAWRRHPCREASKQATGRCRPCRPYSRLVAGIAIWLSVVIRSGGKQAGNGAMSSMRRRVQSPYRRASRPIGANGRGRHQSARCGQASRQVRLIRVLVPLGRLVGGASRLSYYPSYELQQIIHARAARASVEQGGAYSVVIRTVIKQASRRGVRFRLVVPALTRLANISSIYGYRRVLITPGFPLPRPR